MAGPKNSFKPSNGSRRPRTKAFLEKRVVSVHEPGPVTREAQGCGSKGKYDECGTLLPDRLV